jgi:hypothetical protein
LGVGHAGSSFESDEHRRETWFRYRDKLMQQWGRGGRRPQGWWWYEAPEKGLRGYVGFSHERSVLWETPGVLTEGERAELEAQWRREFDRSWGEHFFYCAGPDKIFTGDVARELHWLWADLPPELLDKWMAQRRKPHDLLLAFPGPLSNELIRHA